MPDAGSQVRDSGKHQDPGTHAPPRYSVPSERIVSIEHPCIVRNVDNGLRSLGGEHQIKHVVEHSLESLNEPGGPRKERTVPVVGLSLRPNDPYAKKHASTATATQNILVKVTLPKRTGRKRKRGTSDPWIDCPPSETQSPSTIAAPALLSRLRDSKAAYTLQPLGAIADTHRFAHPPDLQIRASELPVMRELRSHVMQPSYGQLQSFQLDLRPGSKGITAFPGPPEFLPAGQQFPYGYEQVTTESVLSESQQPTVAEAPRQRRRPRKKQIQTNVDKVPTGPPKRLKESTSQDVRNALAGLRTLLETRPIVTKAVIASSLGAEHSLKATGYAATHLGYDVAGGPWAGTLIAYGVDPKSDPKYRVYQTITFEPGQFESIKANRWAKPPETRAHVFDGGSFSGPAKRWQLCDLTDPVLQGLVMDDEIREHCDIHQSGWYYPDTLAKIHEIMRDKLVRIGSHQDLLREGAYRAVAAVPRETDGEWRPEEPAHCTAEVTAMIQNVKEIVSRTQLERVEASFGAPGDEEQGEDEADASEDEEVDVEIGEDDEERRGVRRAPAESGEDGPAESEADDL